MAIVPITKAFFGNKRFKRNLTYHFAGQDSIAPLALSEVTRAMLHLPIGFAKVKDDWMPVALQGLSAKKNLFVLPSGRWVGRYIPICYRFQPFVLASTQDDKQVLCFDDASDLLSDSEGEPFFDAESNPSEVVSGILSFLGQHFQNLQATRRLCAVLDEHRLLTEWPITLQDHESAKQAMLSGLYRVDEEAFNQLDAPTLGVLHQAGALPLIYAQLLSIQNLALLGQISKEYQTALKRAAMPNQPVSEQPDMTFLADDTTISFEGL